MGRGAIFILYMVTFCTSACRAAEITKNDKKSNEIGKLFPEKGFRFSISLRNILSTLNHCNHVARWQECVIPIKTKPISKLFFKVQD